MPMAKNMASGITEATTSPARQLPRNSTSTKITISAPSARLRVTVPMACFTSLVRSRKGSMSTPSGSVFWMVAMRVFTALITAEELAPLSMSTSAPTTSPSWLRVIMP